MDFKQLFSGVTPVSEEQSRAMDASAASDKFQTDIDEFKATVPARFRQCTFASYRPQTDKQREAVEFLKSGRSCVLVGANGLGKTHLGYAACLWQVSQGHRARYSTTWEFVTRCKATYSQHSTPETVINEFAGCGYLVLDEVDKGIQTATDYSYFFALIDRRYGALKPTVLITNSKELHDVSGVSAFDRVASDGAVIELDGENWRKKLSQSC